MGSVVGTLREAVDRLRAEGVSAGVLKVRCFRPFPARQVREALGGARAAAVLDRSLSIGAAGVLATDVKAALYDSPEGRRPLVIGLLAGYGGREVTIDTAREIVDEARPRPGCGRAAGRAASFVGLRRELLPKERP